LSAEWLLSATVSAGARLNHKLLLDVTNLCTDDLSEVGVRRGRISRTGIAEAGA